MADEVTQGPKRRPAATLAVNATPDSSAFLRAIIETTPECIKVVTADGRLAQMNSAGVQMIEAPSWDGVDGLYASDLIAPEHRDLWQEHHDRICRGEALTWRFDIIGLRGTRRNMETHAVPIELSDGSVGQLAITRDISAHTQAEESLQRINEALERKVHERTRALEEAIERLQQSERGFELLVTSVTDYAIFMLDPQGTVVSWNAGARRIKGYDEKEIVGRHFSCFYTEEDRHSQLPSAGLRIAARDGRLETEGWRLRKDGTRFWANVIIDAIHDQGKLVGFAKVTRDITEKKAAEARLRQAQKMEVVGQFTGGAAHDFNNLLMAISGSLELLRRRLPKDARMLALVDNAMLGAKRGISLTQRMLAFARRQELKLEAVGLADLVGGMSELFERSIGPTVRIEKLFPRRIPAVRTDPHQLETALLNLVLNARDAMPAGGKITISAHEALIAAEHPAGLAPGTYVCLSVNDTGQGMDEDTLSHVTEPFFTTKGVGKGTGLGLSMVDGLAAQSGGKLLLRSRLGQGTDIELWLPVAAQDAAANDPVRDVEPTRTEAAETLVVLAVDDDRLVLMSTVAMLEDLGHKVIDAASGEQALALIDTGTPVDLVISDQAMPGMSGVDLVSAIQARRPDMPAILATGYAELPNVAETRLRRLAKPFTQRELAEAVAASIRRARTPLVDQPLAAQPR
ncbi:MAG TPA: PAS domain S-box protein [Steroidobacteraceae bacterium]|nr:PAS domain S-box protein [Steroidobacteraceae bacterium]